MRDCLLRAKVAATLSVLHEPRIASHIGGQYRRQSTLDPDWPLLHHGPQSNLSAIIRRIRRVAHLG